ncbi:hypothetical protein WDM22_28755 [Bradyrhizobium septentrionale]|uniref:Uncharacterized protein n=1 Tax=Bradyrhizobium septentrionale TaxID=1404411 RepID=A0A973W4U4_9BRAD|nr:hypothetical protein [Bradyrhizobium septentrionale]UGY15859.1 hypothetical protein HAP48_0046465 [Bradyrhizobium septentrionale]UGY24433.1 hypothetical protein HU675_0042100 [Bradyrhizobium septentrionale]
MCAKCVELDERSVHYAALARTITDRQTVDGMAQLIAEHEAQKRKLHPEPKE